MNVDALNAVRTVNVRGETVEVKELTWRDYIRAVKEMTAAALKLLGGGDTPKTVNPTDVVSLVLDREKLIETVTSQEELVAWVIQKSTNKPPEWVNSLNARDVLAIISAVIELNLNEEIVGAGKAVAGQMGQVFGSKTGFTKR